MNYYYELDERTEKAFNEKWRYWCLFNCSPVDNGHMPFHVHDEFVAHSSRVWIENANGVYQIKPDWYGMRGQVCPKEFTIIKLKAKTIRYEPG
jgi:hypothetical protein